MKAKLSWGVIHQGEISSLLEDSFIYMLLYTDFVTVTQGVCQRKIALCFVLECLTEISSLSTVETTKKEKQQQKKQM